MLTTALYRMSLVLLLTLSLFACTTGKSDDKDGDQIAQTADPVAPGSTMSSSKSIGENISTDSSYSMLAQALELTNIIGTLKQPGPFTLFAPDDNAFAQLPQGTFEGWMTQRKSDLANILSFHIVAGAIKTKDLADGQKLKTLAGEELIVTRRKEKTLVNGINISAGDIQSANGIIYSIDGVLFPRGQNPPAY